ncbi:MAG: VWA domain-containing protein [Candidatus Yanofskybacteria bacterium]|nr:VWA domain-containing protein [Candidatus Yanofskybacteria bacterium]
MASNISLVFELIKSGLKSFQNTNFDLVRFESLGLAVGAGLFFLLLLVIKLMWGRNRFSQVGSGHSIPEKYHVGKMTKLILLMPKFFLAVAALFLLLSIANPYLPKSSIEKLIESRERIDLVDVSASKGWEFESTGKSAAEIGRKGFLKFLKMRNGQNDRTSLWRFSKAPIRLQDFIIDDEIYAMQAEDMPYVVTDPINSFLPENDLGKQFLDIIAPRDRIQMVSGEGTTDLARALDAVIEYSDRKGDKRIKQKALLIETDAAIDADVSKQLQELRKRRINIYFLYIKPNMIGEMQGNKGKKLMNSVELRQQVEQGGGKFYDVLSEKSLGRAYRDINKLEKAPTHLVRHALKIFIYQRPLLVGFIFLLIAIGFGVLVGIIEESP